MASENISSSLFSNSVCKFTSSKSVLCCRHLVQRRRAQKRFGYCIVDNYGHQKSGRHKDLNKHSHGRRGISLGPAHTWDPPQATVTLLDEVCSIFGRMRSDEQPQFVLWTVSIHRAPDQRNADKCSMFVVESTLLDRCQEQAGRFANLFSCS